MRFTFVRSEEIFSLYLDTQGEQVFLAHGPGFRRLTPPNDINLFESWKAYCYQHSDYHHRDGWLEQLRQSITEPDFAAEVVWCMCETPMHHDEDQARRIGEGGWACESCVDECYTCADCSGLFRHTTTTLNDREVCEQCRDRNWTYCDHCEGYRGDEDEGHDHPDDDDDYDGHECWCYSPAQRFTIRNDGEPRLSNDERVTIKLPAGQISDEGIGAIARYLRTAALNITDAEQRGRLYACSYQLATLGTAWQTRQGNYTKRLSRLAYTDHQVKLTPEVMSRIGCIARDHSAAVDFRLELTRDLNQSPGAFYHDDSCWWQSYSTSRCALKTNGGIAMRSFGQYDEVSGRAWVMPLRFDENTEDLLPTFDTDTDAFVVFNGYGDLEGYIPARVLAHMVGMTYRKVRLSCSPMFVNSDSGYLIAPEAIAAPYTDGSLRLSVDQHANLFETENNRKDLVNA